MIAILFEQAEPPAQYAVVGLISDIKTRNRPERPCAAIRRRYQGIQMHELTGNVLSHHVCVFDVFASGQTKPVKELLAVAHTPSSRRPRGLGIHCMPDTATAMIPTRKAVLQSLLTTLLRRFLTPRHQKMNIPHDDWFRAVVLPIVAVSDFFCCERLSASMARSLQLSFICIPQSARALDQGGVEPRQAVSPKALRPWTIPLCYSVGSIVAVSDGHVSATVCAMAFSIATGKLDLSIQGLFGAGKSRAAAILLAFLRLTRNAGLNINSYARKTREPRVLLKCSFACNCLRRFSSVSGD